MVDPISVIGLISLFNICLEGYKICLAINGTDEDVKILRTRMFLERERFQNVGKTCGLLPHHGDDEKTERLKQFLEEDPFRRQAISDTLELIASLLFKAENLDRKYGPQEGLPEWLKEKQSVIKGSVNDSIDHLRTSLKKFTWSVRDKPAYEGVLGHLVGFNESLERILPGPMQHFLETVLPATVCAASNESELPRLEKASTQHAFLQSQVRWASSVHELTGVSRGIQLEAGTIKQGDAGKDKSRYLAASANEVSRQHLLVDWNPWITDSTDRTKQISMVSGLLGGEKCKELRLLTCAGYLEDHDTRSEKSRYALVYELPGPKDRQFEVPEIPQKMRSLLELLEAFKTIQPPPLEARIQLARTLCRAMLLYHASGWIHHDFRSHNILFMGGPAITSQVHKPKGVVEYQGLQLDQPYVVGFGFARDETAISIAFVDKKALSQTLKQQRLYWSPAYLASSGEKRTVRSFQRSHDIYSLGCVLLETGVWRPLESYTWESGYDADHNKWHRRMLKEEGKLRAMCGSRYAEAVMSCLTWGISDIQTDIQSLAFDILLKLEEIVV